MPQFKFPTLFAAGASATCCFWAIAASAEKPHLMGIVKQLSIQSKQTVATGSTGMGTALKTLLFAHRREGRQPQAALLPKRLNLR
jgi:hypothetical protein